MPSIESLLFNINIDSNAPHQGALLVAEPFLREEYFNHAVICLVEYSSGKQPMGIVLNIATTLNLQSVIAEVTCDESIPVYCGGPLSNDRLYYIHTLGDIIPDSQLITDNLYFGGDFKTIIDYINSGFPVDGHIRFFIGYSGWDIGQLESEIHENVWAVKTIGTSRSLLSGKGNSYWHSHVRAMGEKYRGWLFHPSDLAAN